MKRHALFLLLLFWCSTSFGVSIVHHGRGLFSVPTGGAAAGQTNYLNIGGVWSNTVLLCEFTNSGVEVADNSYYGLQAVTNGAGGAASTWYAETNGISTYRDFDGTDYVQVDDNSNLSYGNGSTDSVVSFAAWINPDDSTGFRCLSKEYDSTTVEYYFGGNASDFMTPTFYDDKYGDNFGRRTTAVIPENVWSFYVGTYDGSGTILIYKDGTIAAMSDYFTNGTYTAMNNSSAPLYIGAFGVGATPSYANGSIDMPMIFSSELTADQVSNLFWATCWNNPSNTYNGIDINPGKGYTQAMYTNRNESLYRDAIIWSPFNAYFNTGGDTVQDCSLNGNHGISAGAFIASDVAQLGPTVNGLAGMNGNDHIDYGDIASMDFGTNDFCVASWVFIYNQIGNDSQVIACKDDGTNRQFQVQATDTGTAPYSFKFVVGYWSNSNSVYLIDQTLISTGQLYHVVAQRVNDSFEIWTNGILSASGTSSGSHGSMDATTAEFWLGDRGDNSADFWGRLDDVYVRQGSLSSNQIQTLYNNGEGWTP